MHKLLQRLVRVPLSAVDSYPAQLRCNKSISGRRWLSSAESEKATNVGHDLEVTESCAKRLSELVGKDGSNKFLRVSVEGGGCSGFQYKFEIEENQLPDDKSFRHPQYAEALVVVDPTSLEYLQGATVDYQSELIRSAFRILKNPKADHGCSCGASFTIKLD